MTFNFSNNFELSTWCDVLSMKVAHIMLGRPWLFYERVQHNGYENTYTLVRNGREKILRPMKEIPPHKQPGGKITPLKLEEPSNILTKKQVEVMWLALHNKLLTNENHFKRHSSFAQLCLMPE